MEAIRKTGIMIGDGKGSFNPDATATRAEIAAIASRLIGYIYEKGWSRGMSCSQSIPRPFRKRRLFLL